MCMSRPVRDAFLPECTRVRRREHPSRRASRSRHEKADDHWQFWGLLLTSDEHRDTLFYMLSYFLFNQCLLFFLELLFTRSRNECLQSQSFYFFLIRVSQGEHLARCNVYLILNDFKNCYSTFNYVIKWLIFSQQPCQWTSCYDSLTIGWSQCMNDVTNFRKIYWRKQLLKICWRHQFSTIWPTLPIFKEEIKECWRQQFIKMY